MFVRYESRASKAFLTIPVCHKFLMFAQLLSEGMMSLMKFERMSHENKHNLPFLLVDDKLNQYNLQEH
jgi:hypothetical protein